MIIILYNLYLTQYRIKITFSQKN